MRVQIGTLTITVESMEELDQLVQRYGGTTSPSASGYTPPTPVIYGRVEEPKPQPESPLAIRCNQLREQHGPVFVVEPPQPAEAGHVIPYGKGHKVELLEPAELANEAGMVVSGRWFAKLVDV